MSSKRMQPYVIWKVISGHVGDTETRAQLEINHSLDDHDSRLDRWHQTLDGTQTETSHIIQEIEAFRLPTWQY